MAYASINSIYEAVKRIANKDNRGFIRPTDFNIYARQAQLEVFHEILSEYKLAQVSRKRFLSYRDGNYNSIENIKDDLSTLVVFEKQLPYNVIKETFSLPDDYAYYIAMEYEGAPVEIVAPEDVKTYVGSFDGAPTEDMPIATMTREGVKLYPDTIDYNVKLTFYKIPQGSDSNGNASTQMPTWAYQTVSSQPLYNPSASINFELPKQLEGRLIGRILSYVGIELREPELYQYAENEGMQQKQSRA